jgi:uncharacterized protein YcfJ
MNYWEKLFHTCAIVWGMTFLIAVSGVAHAEINDKNVMGVVEHHYKTVIQQNPYTVEVCKDVHVPGDKTGDALTGAIIGGVIGNNVTKNVENGAAVGALLGGIIGHNNSKAKGGVKRQCQTETRYNETSNEVYSHSVITFWYDGKQQKMRFTR